MKLLLQYGSSLMIKCIPRHDFARCMIPFISSVTQTSNADVFDQQSEEALYNQLYDELRIGYFSAGSDDVVLNANSTLLRWTGFSHEELVGKMHWWEMFSIGGRIYCETHVVPLLQMQHFVKEIALELAGKNKEKTPVLLQASLTKNVEEESKSFLRGVLIDASDRRAYEREVFLAKARAEELAARLGESERQLRELMDTVLHDLRNPLHSLLLSLEILQAAEYHDNNAAQKRQTVMNIAYKTVEQMKETLENLQSMNALEQGMVRVVAEPCSLRELMESVVAKYTSYAAAKNIELRLDIRTDNVQRDITWQTDRNFFRQSIENLVSNAVKYSPHEKQVVVRLKASAEAVRVEVQDEGPGISEEDMKKLFGKFVRLSARPTGGEHSTGLGLSIVKKMVEAMNGRVWCESEVGKGATFIVELPKAE